MPVCRNCGSRISKLDKDMCPICGTSKPLKGVVSETVEITTEIDMSNTEYKNYHPKSRLVTFMLFFLLGFTGAGFFYMHFLKKGLIWLLINVLLIGGLGILLALPLQFGYVWGFVIPTICSYILNTILGIFYLLKPDIKDGKGDFLK